MALEIKVMSFNIRFSGPQDPGSRSWESRRTPAVLCILSHDPDVVCLQEALKPQFDDLKYILNERAGREVWVGIFAGRNDGADSGEATAILFQKDRLYCEWTHTYWLSDTPDVPGSITRTWGNPLPRICTAAVFADIRPGSPSLGRKIKVLNTHLDYESIEARRRGLAFIMHQVPMDMHAVLCGDFNANPGEHETLRLALRQMDDIMAAGGAGDAATFHGFTGDASSGPSQRIDYIFTTPGAKSSGVIVDSRRFPLPAAAAAAGAGAGSAIGGSGAAAVGHRPASPVLPSDHFPVVASISWADGPLGDIKAP